MSSSMTRIHNMVQVYAMACSVSPAACHIARKPAGAVEGARRDLSELDAELERLRADIARLEGTAARRAGGSTAWAGADGVTGPADTEAADGARGLGGARAAGAADSGGGASSDSDDSGDSGEPRRGVAGRQAQGEGGMGGAAAPGGLRALRQRQRQVYAQVKAARVQARPTRSCTSHPLRVLFK